VRQATHPKMTEEIFLAILFRLTPLCLDFAHYCLACLQWLPLF
jgi:hypothetical protein